MRSVLVSILLVVLAAPASGADRVDLARSYPATLDHSEMPQGYSWTCDENDVWRVNRLQRPEFREWLFDAKSLLPVLFEAFSNIPVRYEFTYDSIDEELADEIFEPPVDVGRTPAEPEPLEKGFDQRSFNVLDGSAGRISIRWGKTGPRGTQSSGLN